MEEFKAKAESLTKSVGDYFETYYKLTVIKAADKATGLAASSLAGLSVFFLSIFVLFFSGLALGVWLGQILDNDVAGYLLVAAFYLLLIFILVLLRKRIVFPFIRNLIVRKFYE
ncbi:MAG: hypothetical protein H7122_15855 [Chitinophagaceae bacterium]|nr:hypothetical protein [Chitinophagaceae bacterium]